MTQMTHHFSEEVIVRPPPAARILASAAGLLRFPGGDACGGGAMW